MTTRVLVALAGPTVAPATPCFPLRGLDAGRDHPTPLAGRSSGGALAPTDEAATPGETDE